MRDYPNEYSTHGRYQDAVRAAEAIADWTAAPAGVIRTLGAGLMIEYVAAAWEALVVWPDDGDICGFHWCGASALSADERTQRQRELRQLLWAHRVGDERTISDALASQTVGMAPRSVVLA